MTLLRNCSFCRVTFFSRNVYIKYNVFSSRASKFAMFRNGGVTTKQEMRVIYGQYAYALYLKHSLPPTKEAVRYDMIR